MATRIVTVSELKTRLGTLMAELEEQGVPLYVTQHGKPKAVLARYDEYEALLLKLEDFEDLLAMKESLDVPEEEAISLDDYERERAGRVRLE
jgi:prevent-host-death family protein